MSRRSTIAATRSETSSGSKRRWRVTTRRSQSSLTMPRRSTIAASRSQSSSGWKRRWPASTRRSQSSLTMPRRSTIAASRSETSGGWKRRWRATTGRSQSSQTMPGAQQSRQRAQRPPAARRGAGQLRQGARNRARLCRCAHNRGVALGGLRLEEALASYEQGPRNQA